MKNTLQEQYNNIKSGNDELKPQFLKQARSLFPEYFNQYTNFDTAISVLKSKQIISEVTGGVVSKGFDIYDWKKILAEEVKAEEKETSKEVKDKQAHAYDNTDMKNADNVNFNEIMKGFYAELKDGKNTDKTGDEIKAMVVKNLAKDPLFYTKDGMFGEKGVGYTDEAPGLGKSKEPKGKYKSSGYGDLDADIKIEKVKSNVQDSLSDKEAKTTNPSKVKEMEVTPKGASGVKRMPMPGAEKKMKLQENKEKRKLSLKLVDKKDKKGLALYKNTEDQNDLYYYDGKVLYSVIDGDRKGPSVRMSLFNITGLQENTNILENKDEQKLRSLIHNIIKEALDENENLYQQLEDLQDELMSETDPERKAEIEAKIKTLETGLDEAIYQTPVSIGKTVKGDGERKPPRALFLDKDNIDAINKVQPNSIKLISKNPDQIYMYVSDYVKNALDELGRGRTTRDKLRKQTPLADVLSDKLSSLIRGKIKKEINPKLDPNVKMHFVNLNIKPSKNRPGYWILLSGDFESLVTEHKLRKLIQEVIIEVINEKGKY